MEEIYIIIELLVLLIIATLSLSIKNRTFNLKLIKVAFILFLIINPLQLMFNSASSNLLIDAILIFFCELIVVHNLISIIIQSNIDRFFQNSFVMITTCLIGILFIENILIISCLLACLIFFILINFFNSGESKEFNEYLPIIISISTGIVAFFLFSLIFTTLTSNISFIGLNVGFEIYIIILLFTVGTLGGIFPFNLLLDKFFKDSDFKTLNLYMSTLYSLLFFLIRSILLNEIFSLQIGLIFLILGILGLTIAIFRIFNELFFKFGRNPISLRKLLGSLFILDFNSVLLMVSVSFFTELTFISIILNYIFFIFLAKFLLMVPLQFKMKEVNTNNLNKLNNLFYEDRFLGITSLISGLITSLPTSFLSFFVILNSFQVQNDIIIFSILIIILIAQSFYVSTNIIGLSSISIKINFNK